MKPQLNNLFNRLPAVAVKCGGCDTYLGRSFATNPSAAFCYTCYATIMRIYLWLEGDFSDDPPSHPVVFDNLFKTEIAERQTARKQHVMPYAEAQMYTIIPDLETFFKTPGAKYHGVRKMPTHAM